MQRVTVILSETLMEAANHVEVLLGKAQSLNTFTVANWTDGNILFAVSSGLWEQKQIEGVQNPAIIELMQSAGRMPEIVDPDLVEQAQAATDVVPPSVVNSNSAENGKILIVIADQHEPLQILDNLGLTKIES